MNIEIADAIKELGGAPFLWQLELATKMKCNTLRANLKGYPEELNISLSEKEVLDNYKSGMTLKELSDTTGTSQNTIRNIVMRLAERGIIQYGNVKYEPTDGKNVYVRVVTNKKFEIKIFGAKRATEVTLKGCSGYIVPEAGKKTVCLIFKDCVPYRVIVDMSDIKVVGKHKFESATSTK